MTNVELPHPVACDECQAGMMQVRYITYFTWLGDELITVPNFPAWICDVCGEREYDERAISWLTMLLNPNTGKPINKDRSRINPHNKADSNPLRLE